MFERLVEYWLTRTNERSLEGPFRHLLTGEGYSVVHSSRHGPFEQGKDIIAISPNGVPCAFQLKTGNISLSKWERIKAQVERLVDLQIRHPSVPMGVWHRAFLVTTGDLSEEVRLEIFDRNTQWRAEGKPILETITRGELLSRFRAVHPSTITSELNVKTLLRFFAEDGRGYLDKSRFWQFLHSQLPCDSHASLAERTRAIASCGLMCAYGLFAYEQSANYVALIEGWTIYISAVLSLAEAHRIPRDRWETPTAIAESTILSCMDALWDEVRLRPHLGEGDAIAEAYEPLFYRARLTWVLGIVCARTLMKLARGESTLTELEPVVMKLRKHLWLWGESAVPFLLTIAWVLHHVNATPASDFVLGGLVEAISEANGDTSHGKGLADPYHSVGEVLRWMVNSEKPREGFVGFSYTLEGLVLLFVKRNWRQHMRLLWPQVTRVGICSYVPDRIHEFYWWATQEGELCVRLPHWTESWSALMREACDASTDGIPPLLLERPELLLLFVLVFPHRLTTSVAKYLDTWATQLKKVTG